MFVGFSPEEKYFMLKSLVFMLFFGFCAFNLFSQSLNVAPQDAKVLCDRVSEIKQLPFHDEKGVDTVYDALAQAGETVVPCLIDKINDTAIMPDPRCPGISTETKVGDVAYFVLVRITKIDFIELFPAEVQKKYKTDGVYAYHEFIERKGKRKMLQSKLREWNRQKQSVKK